MPKRKAAVIAAEQEVLRAELIELDELEEPTDEQVTRSGAALEEFEVLETERTAALAYEEKIALVRSKALDPANVEPGTPRAPEVTRTVDPYEGLEALRSGFAEPTDVISRAQMAVEKAPRHLDDKGREHILAMLDQDGKQAALLARHLLLTGSAEYHREFEEFFESGGRYMGPSLRRAISLTPDSAGGALMPFTFDPTIILTNLGIKSSIRNLATVKQTLTNSWNGVTSDGVTAGWLAENTASGDNTPGFARPGIPAYKAFAWVVGSYEALADSGFASSLGMLVADAKDRLDGAAFATGNGTTQPKGLVTAAVATTASRVASAGASMAVADVFSLVNATSERHGDESVWFAHKSVYNQIRQFSTVTSGGAFWADLGVGTPPSLLGAGAYKESSMDPLKAGTTSTLLVLADPKSYHVVDRVGLTLKYNDMIMSTTTGTPVGQAGWAAFWRTGGDLIDPAGSAKVLRQFTTTSAWV
jgi:HK97 family phage major capsid protein